MKPVTDEELKGVLQREQWINGCLDPRDADLRRHDQIIRLALKRWIIDRREAKRKKEARK